MSDKLVKTHGPYVHKTGKLKGRKFVTLIYESGKRSSKLYSRLLMEQKLGRTLTTEETVDHINRDFTDDRVENLQVLTNKEHSSIDAVRVKSIQEKCPWCGDVFAVTGRQLSVVRGNRKQKKAGPFCSKSCAGKYKRALQLNRVEAFTVRDVEDFKSIKYLKDKQ